MDDQNALAAQYHYELPKHIGWLLDRMGVSEITARLRLIGFDGEHVTVPVFSRDDDVLFMERWSLEYDGGFVRASQEMTSSETALFGAERITGKEPYVVVTEGIMDALVLGGEQFVAISGSGDGRVWKGAWASQLATVGQVFICFKHGKASLKAALKVAHLIQDSKIVILPQEVGEGGGIYDFFYRCSRERATFLRLLANAVDVVRDLPRAA